MNIFAPGTQVLYTVRQNEAHLFNNVNNNNEVQCTVVRFVAGGITGTGQYTLNCANRVGANKEFTISFYGEGEDDNEDTFDNRLRPGTIGGRFKKSNRKSRRRRKSKKVRK
jgi:hypothetical protein